MTDLDVTTVQTRLRLSGRCRAWLDYLEAPDQPSEPELPDDAEADFLLERLGAPAPDRAACLAGRPDPVDHPELWWVLSRAWQDLLAKMGRNPATYEYIGWPAIPDIGGPAGRHLYAWALLAATPHVRRFHCERGIPDDVSWDTLGALGQNMTMWNTIHGENGLNGTWMLPLLFQGVSYRLGRHVFDRGDGALNVHIPEGERLDPTASQASFDRARQFFPRHFPEEPVRSFGCRSWLLDDQWAEYLPETSNIVQFQRRFRLVPEAPGADPASGDADILQFVFLRNPNDLSLSPADIEALPQETTLQRAFVAHLRAGGHWRARSGSFPF